MTLFRALFLGLSFASISCHGFTEDEGQKIIIESDIAERNEITGLTQYSGNVVIRQGSLRVDANSVKVFYQDNSVDRIICYGNPANYLQKTKNGGHVSASAQNIEYHLEDKIVKLKTDASLSRNGTMIKGDSINYDIVSETWRAKGDNKSNQKRIQLVIPPLQKIKANNTDNDLSEPK